MPDYKDNENQKLNENNEKCENVDKYIIPDRFRHFLNLIIRKNTREYIKINCRYTRRSFDILHVYTCYFSQNCRLIWKLNVQNYKSRMASVKTSVSTVSYEKVAVS